MIWVATEKLTTILHHFYMEDVEKEYYERKITLKEKDKLLNSKCGKSTVDSSPFFSFGYMTGEFIDNLDDSYFS